ncbi:MAG: DUF2851 family protein [Ignavibacteria bacterium]|nr:DUF2851 family protein [Ignavibacteria bacterium]
MKKLNLNENFICRIWEDENNYSDLKTNDGRNVEILNYGKRNDDAGPDYSDARIRLDGNVLSGSIEIHRSSADWNLHGHNTDGKYNDVILHVVLYDDLFSEKKSTVSGSAREIPTVVLSEFLSRSIHCIWKDIINKPSDSFKLPCYPKNSEIHYEEKTGFLKELGHLRLKIKSEKFKERLKELSQYIDAEAAASGQVLFEYFCEALGYSKNKSQFISLSRKIDTAKFSSLNLNRMQTDSLVFGMSGFLTDLIIEDEYSEELFSSWIGIRSKTGKEEMIRSEWNFFRLRPPNFPTLRLAYASGLLFEILNNKFQERLCLEFAESVDILKSMHELLSSVEISPYWKEHYNFGKKSKNENKGIGADRIKDIISNVIFPFMYDKALQSENSNLKNKVEYFYGNNKQKAPVNEISKVMQEQIGVKAINPATEQGLIHLHKFYCIKGKCSDCRIGRSVFEESGVHEPLKIIIY